MSWKFSMLKKFLLFVLGLALVGSAAYFAFVKSEGILTANDKDYVDIDNIKKMLVKSDNDKLLIDYTKQLN